MMRSLLLLFLILLVGCYSFQGISIPPEVNTFYVENFEDRTGEIPPGFNEVFSEDLTTKIRTDSRLRVNSDNPDITFTGVINRFTVRAEDPDKTTGTSLNRLYLTIQVTYFNSVTDEELKKTYDENEDFGADQDFFDIQEALLETISERIIERIFNDSFTSW
jgi:hypothetical protein